MPTLSRVCYPRRGRRWPFPAAAFGRVAQWQSNFAGGSSRDSRRFDSGPGLFARTLQTKGIGMLILKRRLDEAVVLQVAGKTLATVRLTDVGRCSARLGIQAEDHITILREELTDDYASDEASTDCAAG